MPTFSTRDYDDILRELEEFEGYLEGMGVPAARVASALAGIREIQSARENGRLLELNTHPRVDELIWSLVEGEEFTRIFRGLRGHDEQAIKSLLKRALRGPRRVIWETQTTNVARNITFELVLGAGLREAGASIELGKDADLILSHEGARVNTGVKVHQHTEVKIHQWKVRWVEVWLLAGGARGGSPPRSCEELTS